MATAQELIIQLYIGYFNRAPDPEGLTYWTARLEAGIAIETISESFAASPEARTLYSFFNDPSEIEGFLTAFYQNVFGRKIDDDGLAYYTQQILDGVRTADQVAYSILTNASTNTSESNTDQAYLANKVATSLYWIEAATIAAEKDGFVFDDEAMAFVRMVLNQVSNDDETLIAAARDVDTFFGKTDGGMPDPDQNPGTGGGDMPEPQPDPEPESDTNHAPQFLQGGTPDTIERVSTDANGNQVDGTSSSPVFSPDGRFVAFASTANNLVQGDTNDAWDIFVKNLETGQVIRVSTAANGAQVDGYSSNPVFSPDGRFVAFASTATNLVEDDTNGREDIFVKNLETGEVIRVSTDANGSEADRDSSSPVFSPDGQSVVFQSEATNLVQGDTNNQRDIFVKNLETGEVTRVNTDASGNQAMDRTSSSPVFSPDGRFVAFASEATNLVQGDTNNQRDIFVKSLETGEVIRVSTDGDWAQAMGGSSEGPVFLPDGQSVAFTSSATNLIEDDTNDVYDIFVKNLLTEEVTRVNTDAGGNQVDGTSSNPVFSPDGRFMAFESGATNLVAGDTNGSMDIFVKNLLTGEVIRVNTDANGAQATGGGWFSSVGPVFSPDGQSVAFISMATNLVAGDTNGSMDIFVKTLDAQSVSEASITYDPLMETFRQAGAIYFSDEDENDTHSVSVIAPEDARGTLTAWIVPVTGGADKVMWSYLVDKDKLALLDAGESVTETFTLTLSDNHDEVAEGNVSVTLIGI